MIIEDNNNMGEQIIDEASIVPADFSWRAGIGKEVPNGVVNKGPKYQQPINGFTPFSASFTPNKGWDIPQVMSPEEVIKNGEKNRASATFDQTLMPELELHTTDIVQSFKGKPNDKETWLELRRKLKEYYYSVVKKYKDNITPKTMERLYNTCLKDYTNDWLFACGNNNVTDVSGSEYVYTSNNEFMINPFVVYSLFSTTISPQHTVNINEEMITELQNNNYDKEMICG